MAIRSASYDNCASPAEDSDISGDDAFRQIGIAKQPLEIGRRPASMAAMISYGTILIAHLDAASERAAPQRSRPSPPAAAA
jgi:hypothetical protein